MKTKEQIALEYLKPRMEATAAMVGKAIIEQYSGGKIGSNYSSVGAAILGRLRYLGLVYRLPELNAWRLTREGRAKVSKTPGQEDS